MRRFVTLPLLLTTLLVLPQAVLAQGSSHLFSPTIYRAVPSCTAPQLPGVASCASLRLEARTGSGTSAARALATPNGIPAGLSPQQLHEAYDLPYSTPGVSAGQTIAIIGAYDDPTAEADLNTYSTQFGLPSCTAANGCFRKVNESGGTDFPPFEKDWAGEISVDVQMAHAICTDCHILLIEATTASFLNLETAVQTAVKMGATEISNSYVGGEWVGISNTAYEHPGIVFTAASGDCGYLNLSCEGTTAYANFPASAPNVIGVGGTRLTLGSSGWESVAWSGSGSGCSTYFAAPAWQIANPGFAATGCGSQRSVADLAVDADPYSGVAVYNSSESAGSPGWGVWGGTSVSSPIVAAMYALAGGAHGAAFPVQTLYEHPSSFTDITMGSNGTCSTSICHAAPGYDGPTGLGSPLGLSAFATGPIPVNSSVPTIEGNPYSGSTLTAYAGTWTGNPSFTYQWQRSTSTGYVNVGTGSTYTLGAINVGSTIRLEVFATNSSGTAYDYSAPTATISNPPVVVPLVAPVAITNPKVTGWAIIGQTLKASPGSFTGSPAPTLAYQWQHLTNQGFTNIPGATSATYRVSTNDFKKRLRILATASNVAGQTNSASHLTLPVSRAGYVTHLKVIFRKHHAIIRFFNTSPSPVAFTLLTYTHHTVISTVSWTHKGLNRIPLIALLNRRHIGLGRGRYTLIAKGIGSLHRDPAHFHVR